MKDIQMAMFSLLLFIAYQIVSPANEKAMTALKEYRQLFDDILNAHNEGVD